MKIRGSVALAALATNVPKDSPESVAQQAFDAVEAARSRCSPTNRPGSSRHRCRTITS